MVRTVPKKTENDATTIAIFDFNIEIHLAGDLFEVTVVHCEGSQKGGEPKAARENCDKHNDRRATHSCVPTCLALCNAPGTGEGKEGQKAHKRRKEELHGGSKENGGRMGYKTGAGNQAAL